MHGKFCVASNRTSIPEVGGDLVDYFDPTNEDDALAKIERLLLEPGYLLAREARLQAEYRPRSWADCVHALIGKLDRPVTAETANLRLKEKYAAKRKARGSVQDWVGARGLELKPISKSCSASSAA